MYFKIRAAFEGALVGATKLCVARTMPQFSETNYSICVLRKRTMVCRVVQRHPHYFKYILRSVNFLAATTNPEGDPHSSGWSGVPSHPTASPDIRDCPKRGVPARRLRVRFESDECEEILRGQAFVPASSWSRAAGDDVPRNAVRRSLLRP